MKEGYHFIGIGGVGMSALAHILLGLNIKVSGSDSKRSAITEGLTERGAVVSYVQKGSNVTEGKTIVYSTAIKEDNPEYIEAKRLNLPILHRSDLLSTLMAEKKELVIAGAHGKTTCTSLLAHVLKVANFSPSYAIGGCSPSLEANGWSGEGEYFVVEGDESDGSFLKTNPYGAILNNIDSDHVGYYWETYDDLLEAYKEFIGLIQNRNLFVYNFDDPTLKKWALDGTTFGFSSGADVRAENIVEDGFGMVFDIIDENKVLRDIRLSLVGRHNVLNATGVYALASRLGVPHEAIKVAFSSFKGVKRRMEVKSEKNNIYVIDDYAHHPKEILETVGAAQRAFPLKRVIKVVQPHRYTRVASLIEEFIEALSKISENLIVTEICEAGESPDGLITTENFLDALEKETEFQYVPTESLTPYLLKIVQPGDIVLMMGAGDITRESFKLSEKLNQESELLIK